MKPHYPRDPDQVVASRVSEALRGDKPLGNPESNDLRHDILLELWDMTEEQQRKARRVVAANALDARDCAALLQALGLTDFRINTVKKAQE